MTPDDLLIRAARPEDAAGILRIARALVEDGTTYVFEPDTSDAALLAYWLPAERAFVAERRGEIVGVYVLRANQIGRGSHVANASYAVLPGAEGCGVGHALGEHSLGEARRLGFLAMQFDFVVATNERAIALWRRLGFAEVGRTPKAFRHPKLGLVDALVMHRFLD